VRSPHSSLLKVDIKTARGNIQEWSPKASSSKAKIDQAKAAQNENRSQGKVLDSLLGLKNAGRLEGFHVCEQNIWRFGY